MYDPLTSVNAGSYSQLALLSAGPRFYRSTGLLRGMAKRGLIAPTGRTDEARRVEWIITDAGRAAILSKAVFPVMAEDDLHSGSKQKAGV